MAVHMAVEVSNGNWGLGCIGDRRQAGPRCMSH